MFKNIRHFNKIDLCTIDIDIKVRGSITSRFMAHEGTNASLTPTGMKLLGETLRDIRRELDITAIKMAKALGKQRSMISMIESGNASVRPELAVRYANQVNEGQPRPKIDPLALAEAYAAVRIQTSGYATLGVRHPWLGALIEGKVEQAKQLLRAQLSGGEMNYAPTLMPPRVVGALNALNPVQLSFLQQVAESAHLFGSDVLSDPAIEAWETANAADIESVLAVTGSLGSELTERTFQPSIARMLTQPKFHFFKYLLVVNDNSHSHVVGALDAWKELKNRVSALYRSDHAAQDMKAVPKSKGRPSTDAIIRKKMLFGCIRREQYEKLLGDLSPGVIGKWDGIYLYKLRTASHLLIGVFRRLAALTVDLKPMTPTLWNCGVMNEALPVKLIPEFEKKHNQLWRDRLS